MSPAHRSTPIRPFRAVLALTVAGGLVALGVVAPSATAATAPAAAPVPAGGAADEVRTWSGTIPAGAGGVTGSCNNQAAISDVTDVAITVPAGHYPATSTTATFTISWNDPNELNDAALTVAPPTGGGMAQTADEINGAGTQNETVTFTNPIGGTWKVRACQFTGTAQAYTGELRLSSTGGSTPTATATATATSSATATATSSAGGGPASDRTFGTPVTVDLDDFRSVAEPSIEVAPNGKIYVTGPQGLGGVRVPAAVEGTEELPDLGGGDLVWRSDDGGQTFTFLGSYDGAIGGGDSDIVAAPDGTLYASGLYLACIAIAKSENEGASWGNNPAGCADGAGVGDRQWNDVDGNEAVYTAYGTLSQGLVIHKSLIDGPVVVNGPSTVVNPGDYQWPGVVDVNPVNGNAIMAWNTTTNDKIQVQGVKRAGGLAYPGIVTVATAGGDTFDSFVSIDHGLDGTLYAAWSERRTVGGAGETWTMLAASRNGGTTWSAPVHVDSVPSTTVFPWVTAGDAGRVAVSYYGAETTGVSPENLTVKNAPWYVYSAFSSDFGATFAEHQTTTSALHRGSICTSGTGCAAGTRDLLDFFETDLDGQGCLLTVFTDNSRDTVSAAGTRSNNQDTRIAVVKQTSGQGLYAGFPCGDSPAVPEAAWAALLPVVALGVIGAFLYRRRLTQGGPALAA